MKRTVVSSDSIALADKDTPSIDIENGIIIFEDTPQPSTFMMG